jgi:hypothetical protein
MFFSPLHTFLFHFRLIPSTFPRDSSPSSSSRSSFDASQCRAPRIYSVKFLPFGHRTFCYIAAHVCRRQDILRSFSLFTPFLRPRFVTEVVLTGSDRRIKALRLASPNGSQLRPPLLTRSIRVLHTPDRPTSSSINNACNPSRLPANPYVLPPDTSRSYHDSTSLRAYPSADTTDRLVPVPQTHSSSRPQTLRTQPWFIFFTLPLRIRTHA